MISACGEVDSSVSRSAAAFGGAVFSPGGRAETGTNRFADRIGSHWTRLLYNIRMAGPDPARSRRGGYGECGGPAATGW